MKSVSLGLMIGIGFAYGCADAPLEEQGNEVLGIARFSVEEMPNETIVHGLRADGSEVGRLELVRGEFALSAPFTEDYTTPTVDGRKLSVDIDGQQLHWETAGYEPVLSMPAHPSHLWKMAAFLDDPHAKAVLDRWQIGFEPFDGVYGDDAERSYTSGSFRGKDGMNCNNSTTCGTAYNGTINTCGGGGAPSQADRLTQVSGTNCGLYTSSYNQVLLAQCCPAGTGGQSTPWFAQKACPTTASNSTSCGTRTTGACKACPTYPRDADFACDTGYGSAVGTCSGSSVYELSYVYYLDGADWCSQYPNYHWCNNIQQCLPSWQSCIQCEMCGSVCC